MCVKKPKMRTPAPPPPPEAPPEVINSELQQTSKKSRAKGTKALQINKNSMAIPK